MSMNFLHYDSIIRVWRDKAYEDIKIGDFVESFLMEFPSHIEVTTRVEPFYDINSIDFANLRLKRVKVTHVQKAKNPTETLVAIRVNSHEVKVNPEHVFKVRSKDPRSKDLEFLDLRADQLVRGKHLLFEMGHPTPDSCWQEIKKIVKSPSRQFVYDIELAENEFFFASGIAVA
jgi:hypothetical protein